MNIKTFIFNPYQVNTYVLYDETKECIIVDPGCYFDKENSILTDFIDNENLSPVKVIHTHGHFDHIIGNKYITEYYKIGAYIHQEDQFIYDKANESAKNFGLQINDPIKPAGYINEGDQISFGNSNLKAIHAPGHSPGSIAYYSKEHKTIICGDVLFYESIGRTDLPKGDLKLLLNNIKEKILVLDDETTVLSGHGPATTVGHEKIHNPFIQDNFFD